MQHVEQKTTLVSVRLARNLRLEQAQGRKRRDLQSHSSLEEDVQNFLRCQDGTVEVHRWITEIPYDAFKRLAEASKKAGWRKKTCRNGRKTIGNIWSQVLDDTERVFFLEENYEKEQRLSDVWLAKRKGRVQSRSPT